MSVFGETFGDGILPLRGYYRRLREREYSGIITLEINDARYYRNPHGALTQCVEALAGW